ncbi:MAG: MBL fold metallo-hydrolase [Kiritimatiellae bacterium]|nr:MBL fold metallo-hydrolase [Kiritimatiellia bacterium]
MKFAVLSSSSSGNSIYVESGDTRILVDAGLSCKELCNRLDVVLNNRPYEIDPTQKLASITPLNDDGSVYTEKLNQKDLLSKLNGICITHEHGDHVSGIPVLSKKCEVPLFATYNTSEAATYSFFKGDPNRFAELPWNVVTECSEFELGDLKITPFTIPHDVSGPVAYVIDDGKHKLGIATDMGVPTETTRLFLSDCDALVLEFNHDLDMLLESDRCWDLKCRVRGDRGHLSNAQAQELLSSIATDRLKSVFLAHISFDCNTVPLAHNSCRETLVKLGMHDQVQIYNPHEHLCKVIELD